MKQRVYMCSKYGFYIFPRMKTMFQEVNPGSFHFKYKVWGDFKLHCAAISVIRGPVNNV